MTKWQELLKARYEQRRFVVFGAVGRVIHRQKYNLPKKANTNGKKADFFLSQTVLFGVAALILLLYVLCAPTEISAVTYGYGMIYGVLLILSQWMFTLALKNGKTSVCSVVYSLGFILPTFSVFFVLE